LHDLKNGRYPDVRFSDFSPSLLAHFQRPVQNGVHGFVVIKWRVKRRVSWVTTCPSINADSADATLKFTHHSRRRRRMHYAPTPDEKLADADAARKHVLVFSSNH